HDLLFFFFTAPSSTSIYTLSLHDALPISLGRHCLFDNRTEFAIGFQFSFFPFFSDPCIFIFYLCYHSPFIYNFSTVVCARNESHSIYSWMATVPTHFC